MKFLDFVNKIKSIRIGHLESQILDEIGPGDFLIGFLLSARSSRLLFRNAREFHNWRMKRKRAIYSLQKKGLVNLRGDKIRLTRFARELLDLQNELMCIAEKNRKTINNSMKRWDSFWHVVIFDIPNKQHRLRGFLRDMLKEVGFQKVQHSTYIAPSITKEFYSFLNRYKDLDSYLILLKVHKKDAPASWVKLFKL